MNFLILPSGPFSPETIAAEGGLLPSWLINELCSHTIEFICEIELTLFIKSLKSRFVSKQYYNRCIRKYICMYVLYKMHVFLPNIRYVLGVLPLLMSDSEKSCDFIKCLVFGLRDFAICEDPKKGQKHAKWEKSVILQDCKHRRKPLKIIK